jgi:hypothetical protein
VTHPKQARINGITVPRVLARKELYTASELARMCEVDLKTIHNWSDRGLVDFFRTPGGHLRFKRVDVIGFLEQYHFPVPPAIL